MHVLLTFAFTCPMRVSGVPVDSVLRADPVELRLLVQVERLFTTGEGRRLRLGARDQAPRNAFVARHQASVRYLSAD